jgi:hypothetical protein
MKWTIHIKIKIYNMGFTKQVGAFTGSVKFFNAQGLAVTIDHLSNVILTSSDETVGTVSIDTAGIISGTGLKAGHIVISVTATNDQGGSVSASTDLTFTDTNPVQDTTAVAAVIQID